MCDVSRRGFMVGCSAAIASLAGARFNRLAFADPGDQDVLVVISLRGGLDGLTLVPPIAGVDRGHYEAARPTLKVPVSGPGAALPLDAAFGLHPAAAPLLELYQNQSLSIIQASGMPDQATRSHFESMEYMELGTPGISSTVDGWLTRHLYSSVQIPDELLMSSLAVSDLQPPSLRGDRQTVTMTDPAGFSLNVGPWLWRAPQRAALRELYEGGSSLVHVAGTQALDAADVIELYVTDDYVPENGAVYPDGDFGDHLQVIAQMIKLDLGLQVATLDLGAGRGYARGQRPLVLLPEIALRHPVVEDVPGQALLVLPLPVDVRRDVEAELLAGALEAAGLGGRFD